MTESSKNASTPESTPTPAADVASPPSDRSAGERLKNAVSKIQANTAGDVEEDLWQGGYSPRAMFGSWLLCVVVSIAAIAGRVMWTEIDWRIVAALIVVIWVVAALGYAYRRLGIHYRLTTQRFIHEQGILSRVTDRIEVIDIDDVTYSQGPIQRIFGVGTIRLTSSDRTHPQLTMLGICPVREVSGMIDDIRRKERRRRSLHIEQV